MKWEANTVMKIETMGRHFREAYRGILKNSWMSFAAMGTVAVTLLIFGVFLIFAFNISYLTKELDKQLAVRASLRDDLTHTQKVTILNKLKQSPLVKKAELVTKDQGLEEMKKSWGDAQFIEGLKSGDQNPLPDIIRLEPSDPKKLKQLQSESEKIDGILSADSGGGVTQTLLGFSGVVRNVILIFGFTLAILAAFLISNTIKLTIIARRKEIEVMRLVGASNWFIRWPFFIEGAFIGVVGAILPIGILLILYQTFFNVMNSGQAYAVFQMMPVSSLGTYLAVSTFILGATIGISGSVLSVRKFLKI
jgi:cell division transport system permease protein